MTNIELNGLLNEFLTRWQIEDIRNMKLNDYVGTGNRDTFCQWVETKTRILGSIKGMTSIKFGIYERKKPNKKPKNYANGKKHSWLRAYGNNENEVFENIKSDILQIIKYSENGNFNKIDDILLPDLFKWKVAFLYSNERLIPIFKRDVLFSIGKHFGLTINRQITISQIHEKMILYKPFNKSVYDFMFELYERFGKGEDKLEIEKEKNIRKRKGTTKRNTKPQIRTTSSTSFIVEQKHNKIQEALKEKLSTKYGEENVILEENYVDVKLLQPDYIGFYEVKSSSYASQCIREALGQVLQYSFCDTDTRKKKIIVVGQYPANDQDLGYINYIKEKLNLDFEYLNISI
ncbi:hypothetical protein [Seonamhaeicola marinus]|uniref:DUF3883 domain-containing protein n=1 Tax=Seonamhaeicola marinus TaxID=1912246 RepID=A0A5D0I3Y3_9FLAO|nr:hypothetical protein [Seonamhaeicola marinus]TYA78395.1 hypothetical protein FUA24_08540 [Seonamhaeicola marinus]